MISEIPDPLLALIGTHLAGFDGSFRRRCDAAADAARLALVGAAECTAIARAVWAAIDPGCEDALAELETSVIRFGPTEPRLRDVPGLGPSSPVKDLRYATGRTSGTKESLWRTVERLRVADRVTADCRARVCGHMTARRDKMRVCWVRDAARREIRAESRCVMDAREIERVYRGFDPVANKVVSVPTQKWGVRRTPRRPVYLVTDVLRAMCEAYRVRDVDDLRAAVHRAQLVEDRRRAEAREVLAGLPKPVQAAVAPFSDAVGRYAQTGGREILERLGRHVEEVHERFDGLCRAMTLDFVEVALGRSCAWTIAFLLHGRGSVDAIVERWREVRFVEAYTRFRWSWTTVDLLHSRGPEVREAVLERVLDFQVLVDVPSRLRRFVDDAARWRDSSDVVLTEAVEISDLLGGPRSAMGRTFARFADTVGVAALAQDRVVRAMQYVIRTAGVHGAGAANSFLTAEDAAELDGASREDIFRAAFLAAATGSRSWLRSLVRFAEGIFEVYFAADSFAAFADAARAARAARHRRRWARVSSVAELFEWIAAPTEACAVCGRTFASADALAAHRLRKHALKN